MAIARLIEIAAQVLAEIEPPLDRWPYTDEFEVAYRRFNELSGREHSRHEVWHYLLSARKRGLGPSSQRRRSAIATLR